MGLVRSFSGRAPEMVPFMTRCTPDKTTRKMGKVSFDTGIDSVQGIIMGSDPFYLRRYKCRDGRILHIVQARPDRSGHVATPAEAANRKAFGERFGTSRRLQKGVKELMREGVKG